MKNLAKGVLLTFLCGVYMPLFSQNVGINTTGTIPNSSAMLDMNTGNTFSAGSGKCAGVLIPNVPLSSATDNTSISNPATSLIVYVPSGSGLTPAGYYYNSGTSNSPIWSSVGSPTNGGNITSVHCTNITSNTDSSFVTISLPAGSYSGGYVSLTLVATNGTDYGALTDYLTFAAANKGGTYYTQVRSFNTPSAAGSGSAVPNVPNYTIINGANQITLQVTALDNLAGISTFQICYTIVEYTGKTITEL
jgi:hypothetical protein